MQLEKLVLRNFKGERNRTIEAKGDNLSIFGENEAGKTTLFDAYMWLLVDKDSRGRSTGYFSLKTKEDGEVIPDIDHEVEAILSGPEIPDGTITLRKVYKEKWQRSKGSAHKTMQGHTTNYFIDGLEVKMSEYQDEVSKIIDEETLRILSDVYYFAEELSKSDRRNVLTSMMDDISIQDVIAGNDDLIEYPEILDGISREKREKQLKGKRQDLDKQLGNIPDRIDQEHKGLYNDIGNVQLAKQAVQDLKSKKEKIEAKRSEVKSGGRIAELKVEKQEIEAEKQKARNQHQQKIQQNLTEQRQKVSELQDSVDEIESEFRQAQRKYHQAESRVEELESVKTQVEQELQDSKDREPKPANAFEPEKCPVCEQTMPDADEHDYEAYLAEFNAEKAEEIKHSKEELAQVEQDLAEVKELFKNAENNAANIKGKMNQRQQALEKAQAELKRKKEVQTPFESTIPYKELTVKIDEIEESILNHRQEKQAQLDQLDEVISDIDEQIEESQSTIHKAKENQRTHQRIAELKEEQQVAAKELEEVEHQLYVIEQYIQAESELITRNVNDKFELVEWKMFEEQLNGGLKSDCTALVGGIPFDAGLNDGHRIRAGLDIINTLSKHYGKSAPIFIDGAESITSFPDVDMQIIALVVKKGLDSIHIERGLDNHLEVPQKSLAAV